MMLTFMIKRNCTILSFIIIALMAHAQSLELTKAYSQVCSTLKDYKFQSEDVCNSHSSDDGTTSISFKLKDGNFIFTFYDDFGRYSDPFWGNTHGSKIITVPISSVKFEIYWDKYLKISSAEGIEYMYKSKKEILENYKIGGSILSLKKLMNELNTLVEIAKNENFNGVLGRVNNKSKYIQGNQTNTNNKSTLGKYVQ